MTGPCGSGKTVYVDAKFRAYNTPQESFTDHGNFLRNNSRYAPAFKCTDNPDQFAKELQKAGYATDPNYAKTLISIMNQYKLKQFDAYA